MSEEQKKCVVFGSAEYLVEKFDDVESAVESRKSKAARDFKALVETLATKRDNMRVYKVLKTVSHVCDGKSEGADGKCHAPVRPGYVAHVCVGLNGKGKQADYLSALRRLVEKAHAFIFDVCVDALDDVVDVLVRIS